MLNLDKKPRKTSCNCVNCGKKGNNHDFIMVITFNSKRSYYCSEECRNSMTEAQKMKSDCEYAMVDIIGTELNYGKVAQDFVKQKIKEYEDQGHLETLHNFLYRKLIEIKCKVMFKEFKIAKFKAKYVFAIIDSEIQKELEAKKIHEMRIVEHQEVIDITPDKKLKGGKDISGLIGI